MRVTVIAALVCLALAGCGGEARERKTTLELKDVPPEIMKVAREQLPGVTFDAAWKKSNGSFEVRGKARDGKVREVDIRPDGSVEEVE